MRKFITSIILTCLLCLPIVVDARTETFTEDGVEKTCDIITNYYFMLEEPSSLDKEAKIDDSKGRFSHSTDYTATYDNTIKTTGDGQVNTVLYKKSDLDYHDYHQKLFMALDNYKSTGSTEYKYSNDYYYYLQNTYSGTGGTGSLPFFAETYLSLTSSADKIKFKNSVYSSYVYLDGEYCHNCDINVNPRGLNTSNVTLDINKNYNITATRENSTSTIFYNTPDSSLLKGPWYTVGSSHSIAFIPALYIIEHYDPVDCEVVGGEVEDNETKYKIIYDPNGGIGESKEYLANPQGKHKIISNDNAKFTKSGYKFSGWSTNQNATTADTTYAPDQIIPLNKNITLYAIWEKIGDSVPTYKVTYYENAGNDVKNKDDDLKHGESYKIMSGDIYTREGYKFLGWSTNKDATKADTNYSPDKVITVDKDLDLYAVWLKEGNKEEGEIGKHGLGYSIGLIGTILAGTGAGVVYFKKRNKFENI